jgi:broad specificity phosphatase PhoE
MRRLLLSALLLLLISTPALAQSVFVVRHAERADAGTGGSMTGSDPDLSETGKARAQSLVAALKDAKITAIYTTEYKRTQQTGEPLAKALGLQVIVVPAKDGAGLIEKVKAAQGNVLVVGHSNTVPEVIKQLGATDPVKLGESDYDDLFIVTRGTPTLLRLHLR